MMNYSRKERIQSEKRAERRAKRRKFASLSLVAALSATSLFYTETVKAEAGYYTVQRGDTLKKIAKKYSVTVKMLKAENQLTSDELYVGQRLEVPTHRDELGVEDNPGQAQVTTHTVVKGDTLYKISKKYGVTVDQVKQLNHLTSDRIYIGQQLTITASEPAISETLQRNAKIYTVVAGDTLYGISKRYQVGIDQIKGQNGFNTDRILIGQKLLIPNEVIVERATVVGAIDQFTVEFTTKSGSIALKVAYGTAESYEKLSGKPYVIGHRNAALISIQTEK